MNKINVIMEDKLKIYLENEIKDFLFDQLSDGYLERNGMAFMKDVPVPFTPADLVKAQEGTGFSVADIADNMAIVLGADPNFKYKGAYLKFLARCFSEKLVDVYTGKGGKLLSEAKFHRACVYFRAALVLDPEDRKAVFGCACVCRQWYLSLEGDEEYIDLIAALKEESRHCFEECVRLYPDFADAYYFLGYAYLNEAQYIRANATWKKYVKLVQDPESEEVQEIKERLDSLKDPVIIETGINELTSGRIERGLQILEPYTESSYRNWWPLHYYLAEAYRALGLEEEAIEGYRKVIELSPSNIESNQALADMYASAGNAEMADKYLKKVEIIRKNNER